GRGGAHASNRRVGIAEEEVGAIEGVQEINLPFKAHTFRDGDAFPDVDVKARLPRPEEDDAVAELTGRQGRADVGRVRIIRHAGRAGKGRDRVVNERLRQPIDDAARVFADVD